MQQQRTLEALEKLRLYVERENFKGYDPYDTLNSVLPFSAFGKWPGAIVTQIQKRNPFNIRPLLGIKKDHNPKALGLFLNAYCQLHQSKFAGDLMPQMRELIRLLKSLESKGYSGTCWGYNFTWASSVKVLPAFSPNVVVTAFIAKGLFAYYQLTKDEEVRSMLLSIAEFVIKDLERTVTPQGVYFSYTTVQKDCCYNASLLAAEILAMSHTLKNNELHQELALKAVDFVVAQQKSDGCWYYSMDPVTGRERKQIDFHQGYIIDSIQNITRLLEVKNESYSKAVELGLKYYHANQFFEDGRSLWRVPEVYPVEIHNQSQGIITFAQHPQYRSFAFTIAEWTIQNMADKDGFFYYRRYKTFTNRIPFMRWSQAWMLLALATLLTTVDNKKPLHR